MEKKYGVQVAGGQAELKGKVIRIAHMGYCTGADIILTLSALEMALVELGWRCELGAGVRAAEAILSKAAV
jgi:aspartate aminotransferase-like enzyme